MKPRVLFVGCHPFDTSGNGHFMSALLDRVDAEKFDVTVFAGTVRDRTTQTKEHRFSIIEAGNDRVPNYYGQDKVVDAIRNVNPEVVIFVGLDLWTFQPVFPQLVQAKRSMKFKWASIFPYDAITLRDDWTKWLEMIDFPCVYSQYGYDMLNESTKHVRYFRPPLFDAEKFVPNRKVNRQQLFPSVREDGFIFGLIGNNQFRKDPLRAIRAFFNMKQFNPKAKLYLHMELEGVFNIEQYIKDCGGKIGDVLVKKQKTQYTTDQMSDIYNNIDCLISTSLQEGLSWTIVEAMLCGTPYIIANNTAHSELIELGGGWGIECTEFALVPLATETGFSWVESRACNLNDLESSMLAVSKNVDILPEVSEEGVRAGKEWLEGVSDINNLLEEAVGLKNVLVDRVLFAQHSSAGDVLMTTRCFEGLKKRFPGMEIDYMTSPQYMNIVEGNPNISKVIPWNDIQLYKYKYVVNPHGDRIAPGHWGRNSNSQLVDFYWKILKVEPTDAQINLKRLANEELATWIEDNCFVVVHTTGGDPQYRTYRYMSDVCKGLKERGLKTVQLGGAGDYPAGADVDLRGKLSFQETAWIMDEAAFAITVDSFIAHLAGFLSIPQVCLFGSGNHNVVKPIDHVICMVPDYINFCKGLGPCSAAVRDCPVKCTGIHDPDDVLKNFDNLTEIYSPRKEFLK